jgi:hypothetical protein
MLESCRSIIGTVVLGIGLTGAGLRGYGQEATPSQLRDKANGLEKKAAELKQSGRGEESLELMQKAAQLRLEARRGEEEGGKGRPRPEALKQKLSALQAELKELEAAGKMDEADKVRRNLGQLKRELAPEAKPPGKRPPGEKPALQRSEPTPGAERQPAVERDERRQHLQEAIRHLQAAGLPEAAERLARRSEMQPRREINGPRRGRGEAPAVGPGAMAPLRGELEELRGAIRELRAQLEEMRRERR